MKKPGILDGGSIHEPSRDTPIVREVDVVVCGGGLGGIGAALGAARSGARTLIIERNAWIGGAATASLMNTWNVPIERMSGIARQIAENLVKTGHGVAGGPTFPFDSQGFMETSIDLLRDAGAEILSYSWVVDPIMDGSRIRGVIAQNKSGRQAVIASTVIDATGDADIVASAGGEYIKGRENDGMMRPMTVLMRLGGVDVRRAVKYCRAHPENFTADPNIHVLDPERGLVRMSGFFDIVDRARASGELPDEVHYIRLEGIDVERGVVTVNNSRVYGVDGTNAFDITRADLDARRQNRMLFDVIRKNIPGFENAWVIDSSPSIGIRETRRIRGPKLVRGEDFDADRRWPDSVARIWRHRSPGRDPHKPDGGEGAVKDPVYRTAVTKLRWFELPWGVFTPNGVDGLLVGGRIISVTYEADIWTRGQFCCLVTGQVAGVAAAIAAAQNILPSDIEVTELQRRLAEQGVDIGSAGQEAAVV